MSYRIVQDDAEDDGGLGRYVGETADGQAEPLTAEKYYRRFLIAVFHEREDACVCFRRLVRAGCKRLALGICLSHLDSPPAPWPRTDLREAAEQISNAGKKILHIELTPHGSQVDPDGRFRGLHWIVWQYAQQLERVAESAPSRKIHAGIPALASLVGYVKARTGRYYDAEVATLVEAVRQFTVRTVRWDTQPPVPVAEVEAVTYSTENHERWRRRHEALVQQQVAVEARRRAAEEGEHTGAESRADAVDRLAEGRGRTPGGGGSVPDARVIQMHRGAEPGSRAEHLQHRTNAQRADQQASPCPQRTSSPPSGRGGCLQNVCKPGLALFLGAGPVRPFRSP